MKSTFNVIYYIRRDRLKKDGTAPIFCRITISQEKVSFNIKAAINTDIWESSTGVILYQVCATGQQFSHFL